MKSLKQIQDEISEDQASDMKARKAIASAWNEVLKMHNVMKANNGDKGAKDGESAKALSSLLLQHCENLKRILK